jgi:transketolase
VVREGEDAIAFAYGPWLLSNTVVAADEIEQATGIGIRVVNLPWLNRVDRAWLRQAVGARRSIVTLDNHYLAGGQGEMIAAAIAELELQPAARVTRLGVAELPECGTNDEVLAYHRLDVPSLVRTLGAAASRNGAPGAPAADRKTRNLEPVQ